MAAVNRDVGPGRTYPNIMAAVNAADPGDTINIYDDGGTPNVYNENVTLNPDNLSLIGYGDVTIKAFSANSAVVTMSKGSTLKNFTIQGVDGYGVLMAENCTVENNKIKGNYIGIRGPEATNLMIINNKITDNQEGIYIDSGIDVLISWNSIANNVTGINSQSMNYLTITRNLITGNQETAIHADGNYFFNISDNRITANGAGIHIFQAEDIKVHFNHIYQNTDYGLYNELYPNQPYNGMVYAQNNWWGYNEAAQVQSQIINIGAGSVIFSRWLVLNLSPSSSMVFFGRKITITADLTRNSNGQDTFRSGHLPDGIPITFTTNLGNLGRGKTRTAYTVNGKAIVTLKASEGPGIANITATLDGQTVSALVLILKFPRK
ncbi:MAG: right-handed parallel beta-helix repeat-containing protein [Methanobacteriaceae archaeon]